MWHFLQVDCSCAPQCRSTAPLGLLSSSTTPTRMWQKNRFTSIIMLTTWSPRTVSLSHMPVSNCLVGLLFLFYFLLSVVLFMSCPRWMQNYCNYWSETQNSTKVMLSLSVLYSKTIAQGFIKTFVVIKKRKEERTKTIAKASGVIPSLLAYGIQNPPSGSWNLMVSNWPTRPSFWKQSKWIIKTISGSCCTTN